MNSPEDPHRPDSSKKQAQDSIESGQPPGRRQGYLLPIIGVVFKLFKSAAAVKVALAGMSFAGWSLLTDYRFAAMLISIIVFHEWGHVRAMKHAGIATKGIYLLPFMGGIAVGEKARTYWQETYISMMGPVFGLVMSVAAWIGWAITDWPILGLVASYSALINLFNLLPIYPLDGGHVVKAIAFSATPRYSVPLLIAISAAGFALSIITGVYLLSFFIVLGAIDLLGARSAAASRDVVPMGIRTRILSLVWYAGVITVFVVMIFAMSDAGIPGADIPMIILTD